MIVLDTNLVSEPLRLNGNPIVLDWLDRQAFGTLYLTAITVAELRFGIAILPAGRRKETLDKAVEERVLPLFEGRVLPFDIAASKAYATICSRARGTGKAIAAADGYIAAIAAAHQFAVATRDTAPFEAAGITVINPGTARSP